MRQVLIINQKIEEAEEIAHNLAETKAEITCIAYCYMIGKMDFGRNSPIIKMSNYFGEDFPFTLSEYRCSRLFNLFL